MRTILIDLDGTLVDPAPGIVRACQHALAAMGRPVPSFKELLWIIGPPPRASLQQLLGPDGDPEECLRLYRECYRAGAMFEAIIYPGIVDALEALSNASTRMFVCTAKSSVFAERIVEHLGLGGSFERVYGAELGGRFEDKGELIAHMIQEERFDPASACMIGDRRHDVAAALHHGIPAIGVLWGYGDKEELTEAGAAALCATPKDLPALVNSVVGR